MNPAQTAERTIRRRHAQLHAVARLAAQFIYLGIMLAIAYKIIQFWMSHFQAIGDAMRPDAACPIRRDAYFSADDIGRNPLRRSAAATWVSGDTRKIFLAHAGDCPLPQRVVAAVSDYAATSFAR